MAQHYFIYGIGLLRVFRYSSTGSPLSIIFIDKLGFLKSKLNTFGAIFNTLAILLLSTNFLCCLWIFLGQYDYSVKDPNFQAVNSWLIEYEKSEEGSPTLEKNPFKIYTLSFYFMCEVMTTVGYGELYTKFTNREMIFLCMLEFLTIGFVASVIYSINTTFKAVDNSMEQKLRDYLM